MAERGGGSGRASVMIAAGTLASRLLGLVRMMVLAYAIGSVGFSADAFATAGKVPNTVFTLIATGALTAVLVPQITKAALAADGGVRYINKLVTLTVIGSGGITLVIAVATPSLIGWLGASWGAQQVHLATVFAYWLLPQILFFSLYTVLGEVLNARSVFGPYAWAPVLNNVLNMAGLVGFVALFGADPDGVRGPEVWTPLGEGLVAGSAMLGVAAQALVLFAFWKRAGLAFRFDFGFRGVGLGTMGAVALWTFMTVLLTQAVGLYNSRIMNLARPGEAGVFADFLSSTIFVLPHAIITISLITARFTRMSENVHAGRFKAFVADITSSVRLAGFAMAFFAAAMLVLAFPLIRLIQPSASHGVIAVVAPVLMANVVGLVPFSLLFVLNRGFFALSDTRTPFFIALGQSALVLTSASLIGALVPSGLITVSLTLAVSTLIALQMVATFLLLRRRIGRLGGRAIFMGVAQDGVAAVIAGAIGLGVLLLLGGVGEGSFPVSGVVGAFASCALVTTVMAAVYLAVLVIGRNHEARELLARVRAMLPGGR